MISASAGMFRFLTAEAGKQIQSSVCIPSQEMRILTMFSKGLQYSCRGIPWQIWEESRMKATGIVRRIDDYVIIGYKVGKP